ncbi:hypothetical protein ACOSP7_017253 [Xanthoceras sorbifolium]
MGFPGRWVSLIMDCISTVSFSFVINGKSAGRVFPSRGLRQGCPLSPYLFILCAEALSCMIQGAEQDGRVLGFRCCRGSPLVSHLFFADDSLVFCKANIQSCLVLKNILEVYSRGSGQLVNFQKSAITFSPNVLSGCKDSIQIIFDLARSQSHDRYLSLPTLVGKNRKKTFHSIIDKVWKRVSGWKWRFFFLWEAKRFLSKPLPKQSQLTL